MNGNILINTNNLKNNLSEIKKSSPNTKIMSVIKSNGYGHGILEVANALENSDSYAIATIEEAKYLRKNNITKEIVCLQGFSNEEECLFCSKNNIRPVIHNKNQIEIIKKKILKETLKVWIKIDTGMNRLGFDELSFKEAYEVCTNNNKIKKPIGLMTHLACADEKKDEFSNKQIEKFTNITKDLNGELSILNSAGILRYTNNINFSEHWVRPGIMLYGINPCNDINSLNLKPVMSLTAPVIAIKTCKKGEAIGYGQSFTFEKDTRIASIGIGYGDGYSRQLSDTGKVFFEGNFLNIVGRISMDIITVDVKDIDIKIGSFVELWGDNINIKDVSDTINTIPYELMCSLGDRLNKKYI